MVLVYEGIPQHKIAVAEIVLLIRRGTRVATHSLLRVPVNLVKGWYYPR